MYCVPSNDMSPVTGSFITAAVSPTPEEPLPAVGWLGYWVVAWVGGSARVVPGVGWWVLWVGCGGWVVAVSPTPGENFWWVGGSVGHHMHTQEKNN